MNTGATEQTQQTSGAQPQVIVVHQPSQQQQPTQNQGGNAMFTQEQVNAIVGSRVSQLNAKIAELTKANETMKADADSYKTKFEQLEQKSILAGAGIPDTIAEYAMFEIAKMSANGKTFAENTAEYVKANESFINTIKQSGQSTPNQANQQAGQQGANNGQAQPNQSMLLQQLAGQATNTNGAGNMNPNVAGTLDVDKILAAEGLKRKR